MEHHQPTPVEKAILYMHMKISSPASIDVINLILSNFAKIKRMVIMACIINCNDSILIHVYVFGNIDFKLSLLASRLHISFIPRRLYTRLATQWLDIDSSIETSLPVDHKRGRSDNDCLSGFS